MLHVLMMFKINWTQWLCIYLQDTDCTINTSSSYLTYTWYTVVEYDIMSWNIMKHSIRTWFFRDLTIPTWPKFSGSWGWKKQHLQWLHPSLLLQELRNLILHWKFGYSFVRRFRFVIFIDILYWYTDILGLPVVLFISSDIAFLVARAQQAWQQSHI